MLSSVIVLLLCPPILAQRQQQSLKAIDMYKRERELDKLFLVLGTDGVGSSSATELHASFIVSTPRALEMSRLYRLHFLELQKGERNSNSKDWVSQYGKKMTCDPDARFRTGNGSCNNLLQPELGMSFIPFRRFVPPAYEDGASIPRTRSVSGDPLPGARTISRELHTEGLGSNGEVASGLTHIVMQWAQFLDHDITATGLFRGESGAVIECCLKPDHLSAFTDSDGERFQCFPIDVPPGDPAFDTSCMNFVRSIQVPNANGKLVPVEQVNQATSFVDGSMIYGHTQEIQDEIRMFEGGLLLMSSMDPQLLPRNPIDFCLTSEEPNFCFLAGDERVDEHMALHSMHTIWMREHNRIVKILSDINPSWDDERLFQEGRKIVGAMIQHITYTAFLPIVLPRRFLVNNDLLPSEQEQTDVYHPSQDPSIRNAFATAAYRFGHSLIRSLFSRITRRDIAMSPIQLGDSFGNTSIIIGSDGADVDNFIRGLITDEANPVDRFMSAEITERLFEDPFGERMDLMSLNVQRARDHGIPSYNEFRRFCGLPVAGSFEAARGGLVDHSEETAAVLEKLYKSPDDIDLFSGGISEESFRRALLGRTFSCLISRQFSFLKTGDRFFYENTGRVTSFTQDQLREIKQSSLARVICDNTNTRRVQPNAFRIPEAGRNEIARCRTIPSVNLEAWLDDGQATGCFWTSWQPCIEGYRSRQRVCPGKQDGTEPELQKEPCNTACKLGAWSEFGVCIRGCRFRRRECPCAECPGTRIGWERCGDTSVSCDSIFAFVKPFYWLRDF